MKLRGQAGAGQEKAPLVRYDDLRESLGDPRWARGAERSRHEEDGTFEQTIIAVYQSCQMASVVDSALMEFVQDAGMVGAALWFLEGWTGYHRPDVVGRTMKSVLNNMRGPEGDRLFNAEFFPLARCRHMGEAMDRIEQAQYWLEHPWTLSPTTEWHSAYAHDATIRNKSAFDTFTKVWQSRTKANEVICSQLTGTTGDHIARPSHIPEQEEDGHRCGLFSHDIWLAGVRDSGGRHDADAAAYCRKCGAFAYQRVQHLATPCAPFPGSARQLAALRAGRLPGTSRLELLRPRRPSHAEQRQLEEWLTEAARIGAAAPVRPRRRVLAKTSLRPAPLGGWVAREAPERALSRLRPLSGLPGEAGLALLERLEQRARDADDRRRAAKRRRS